MASEKSRYIEKRRKVLVGVYPEEKTALLQILATVEKQHLLDLLAKAYDEMTPQQRRMVFEDHLDKLRIEVLGGSTLLKEIADFKAASLRGDYYAPFNINGNNCTHIPPETREWFDRVGDFLKVALGLVEKEEYEVAISAFAALFDLIEGLCDHDIVFADEFGSWMVPVHFDRVGSAWVKAVAKTMGAKGFAEAVVKILNAYALRSASAQIYSAAEKLANAEQMAELKSLVEAGKVRVGVERLATDPPLARGG